MLDRVSVRIGLAFAVVGLATMLAVGAGLFVTLRELHRDVTRAAMADIAQPLVARIRLVAAPADLRARLAELRAELSTDFLVFVLTANGRVLGDTERGIDVASIVIDPTLVPGEVVSGSLPDAAGTDFLYAATVVARGGPATGSSAIVLVTQDRSAGAAWRDVTRVLPVVILIAILLGVPIAWLLSRSITRPLRRLAAATADVPSQGARPLPLEGPREVRELTERFNAMTAELDSTRRGEAELLANIRHDLRTPLTVIGGFAMALQDGTAAGGAAVRAARAISEETDRIERLVDGIGTIEEVRTGRLELRPEPLDAAALVAAAVERFAPGAAAAGIELRGERAAERGWRATRRGRGRARPRLDRGPGGGRADPRQPRRERHGRGAPAGRARPRRCPSAERRRRADDGWPCESATTAAGSRPARSTASSTASTGPTRRARRRDPAWASRSCARSHGPTAATRPRRTSPPPVPG